MRLRVSSLYGHQSAGPPNALHLYLIRLTLRRAVVLPANLGD